MSYQDLLDRPVDYSAPDVINAVTALRDQRAGLDYAHAPLILLGAGSVMAQPFVEYAIRKLKVVAVVDNARAGQTLYDHPVIGDAGIASVLQRYPEATGIICAGTEKPAKHFENLLAPYGTHLLFYFEALPYLSETIRGITMFNELQTFSDLDRIVAIQKLGREILNDVDSLRTLDALLMYRLTWDASALETIRRPHDQIYLDSRICPLGPEEIFVDGGAYDGDTVTAFAAHVGNRYRHIHAFELDPQNYHALVANTRSMPNVTCHAAGLWSHPDTISFAATGAMGSRIDDSGAVKLRVDALDNMGIGDVTYIKLDIEGAEGPALEGMAETIRRFKPKLAISAYHKADDLIRLVEIVRALRSDYVFELRHYSSMVWDSVLYAA